MILAANPGNPTTLLEPGIGIILVNGATLAQTTPGQALNVTPGNAGTNPIFTVNTSGENTSRVLNLHPKGVGGTLTSVQVQIYSSDDGTNWNEYGQPITLVQAGVLQDIQAVNLVAGLQYQVLATTVTLNTATALQVDGQVS